MFSVDRGSTILGMSCLFCGLITLLMSYANSFLPILLLRSILGAIQAFGAPASVYLITSCFKDSSDRVIANAAYTIGVYLGAGASSLSTLIDIHYGWRFVLQLLGYATIISASIYEVVIDINMFQLTKPRARTRDRLFNRPDQDKERRPLLYDPSAFIDNSETDEDEASTNEDSSRDLSYNTDAIEKMLSDEIYIPAANQSSSSSNRPSSSEPFHRARDDEIKFTEPAVDDVEETVLGSLRVLLTGGSIPYALPLLLLASGLRFMAGIAIFVFFPVLMARVYPTSERMFSVINASILLICGSTSTILGGRHGQQIMSSEGLSGIIHLAGLSVNLCILPFTISMIASMFWVRMIALASGYLIGEAWMSLALAILQAITPKRMQGLSMAFYLFFNWITSAIALEVIGWIDAGTDQLSNLLAISVLIFLLLSSFCFWLLEGVCKRHK
jgi:hypothetical protein